MPNSFKIDASKINETAYFNLLREALSGLSISLVEAFDLTDPQAIEVKTQRSVTIFALKDALEQAATKTLSGAAARTLVDKLTISV